MKSCQSHIFRHQRCDALRAAGPAQSYGARRATKVMLISNQLLLVLNIAQIVDGFECDFAKKSILEELLVRAFLQSPKITLLNDFPKNPHHQLESPADRSGSFDTDLFVWPDHTVYYRFEVRQFCSDLIQKWRMKMAPTLSMTTCWRTQWVMRTKMRLRKWWRGLRTILAYASGGFSWKRIV